MNTLILGGESFAGSHYINSLLKQGHNVDTTYRYDTRVPYNKEHSNLTRYIKDIYINSDEIVELIKQNDYDLIVNFIAKSSVAPSWKDPSTWMKINAVAPMKIIHEGRDHIKKFIQMSTPEVYGNWSGTEKNVYRPSTPYAISKAALDMYTECLYKEFNFPIINTRASNWFGPYQQYYKIIPTTISNIMNEDKLRLEGGGESRRNFMYIEDFCNALDFIYKYGKDGETYHVSTNEYVTIKELVMRICEMMNYDYYDLVKVTDDRVGKDMDYELDHQKLSVLGWRPYTTLDEGLDKTIDWFRYYYE